MVVLTNITKWTKLLLCFIFKNNDGLIDDYHRSEDRYKEYHAR